MTKSVKEMTEGLLSHCESQVKNTKDNGGELHWVNTYSNLLHHYTEYMQAEPERIRNEEIRKELAIKCDNLKRENVILQKQLDEKATPQGEGG